MDTAAFVREVPQIVPQSWCLQCKICCRFPATEEVQTPTWSAIESRWGIEAGGKASWFREVPGSPSLAPNLEPCGSGYRCPAFEPESSRCTIYPVRPLDCRLYPFVLARDPGGTKVTLAMDMKCPYLQEHGTDPEVAVYAQRLARYLETDAGIAYLKTNPQVIGPSWPEFISVAAFPTAIPAVREPVEPPHPALQPFTWAGRRLLEEALQPRVRAHSGYTPAGIFGWADLIRYWWAELEGSFCLFAEQAGGWFMPFPPFGKRMEAAAIRAAWRLLKGLNQGSGVSRIEGIEAADRALFSSAGFGLTPGEPEYLYRREDLVNLRGDRYRSQRWAVNRFKKRGAHRIRPFEDRDLIPCLQLYTLWGIRRQQAAGDSYPKGLIRDGLFFHRRLMMNHRELRLEGRVLEVEGEIRGYTFGVPLSPRLFLILLEISDLSMPGSAQTLFREFCREMEGFDLINAMGDSALPGLRQAKLAYHPVGFIPTSIATEMTGAGGS